MKQYSNDIIAKVYAQYLGQKVVYLNQTTQLTGVDLSGNMIHLFYIDDEEDEWLELDEDCFKLTLKPLSAISDEQAHAIGFLSAEDFIEYSRIYTEDNGKLSDYQYLINEGFDLPHRLLDGKTLNECNLCLYS